MTILLVFFYLFDFIICLVASLRLNDSDDGLRTSGSRRSSGRKPTVGHIQHKPKDSTDSVCRSTFCILKDLFFS
jgi:hypothetical protein